MLANATAEQASWIVVAAAERLAAGQLDPGNRDRYSEAARRMRHAARSNWSDEAALRAASPILIEADGRSSRLVEAVSEFGDDPEAGVRAAIEFFLSLDWRQAA
jgi:hypothetical protein